MSACERCGGEGTVEAGDPDNWEATARDVICPECGGKGETT